MGIVITCECDKMFRSQNNQVPTNINQISRDSNINIPELSSKLLMMELEGLIESYKFNIKFKF